MKNRILKGLPAKEHRVISPELKPVALAKGAVLYEAGERLNDVYFPEKAMVSYLSSTSEGETLEVCVVGNDGVVGVGSLLGDSAAFRAVVQIPGEAYALSLDVLRREFRKCDALHNLLIHYTHAMLIQVAQTGVCNKFHSVQERLCRWLLIAQDRAGSDRLPLTQDGMARVLGSRRASVTVVAGALQRKNIIRYSRGVVTILDRKRLEAAACECYDTISSAQSR